MLGILLRKAEFKCVAIHSLMHQRQRLASLNKFKSSNTRLLVATDVAARGLDIPVVQVCCCWYCAFYFTVDFENHQTCSHAALNYNSFTVVEGLTNLLLCLIFVSSQTIA